MAFKLIVQNSKILLKSVANYIINATGIKDLFTGDSSIDSNGKINWTLQHYADTAANFTSNNPTLLVGQIGIETDNLLTTPKFKIGDGANDWNTLPYANSTSGGTWGTITGTLSNQTDLQTALNAKEDTANKSTNVNTDQASNTKYPSVKAVYDWATGLFVKKGTLTANTIPKATASDAIGNSQITDDGTNVGIVGNIQIGGVADARLYIKNANGNYYFAVENGGGLSIFYINPNGRVSIGTLQDIYKLKVDGSFASATIVDDGANVGINTLPSEKLHVNGNIRCDNLTASQIVGTDASKNLVSIAFGTTAGTVLEGDRITQTITNGVTDKAPSEDAVFDALALKLTAANNLSDLANPLTARNNLKIWDLFLTGGDQSTTSNVASNITDLVSTTLTANKRYRIHGVIKVGCNNTGGVKFQITLPSGASMDIALSGSNTSNTAYINATLTSSATLSAQVQSFNGLSMLRVDGEISLGVTAGTIQFGFASGTNTQTSTVYQLGTHLTVTQIN